MKRRNFFAALAAPFIARWMPKPAPITTGQLVAGTQPSIITLVDQRMAEARRLMAEEFAKEFFRPRPLFRLSEDGWYGKEDS